MDLYTPEGASGRRKSHPAPGEVSPAHRLLLAEIRKAVAEGNTSAALRILDSILTPASVEATT